MKTALGGGPRVRAWLATLLTALLVVSGLSLTAMPASAATGDVTSATLNWGVKQSFRNYLKSPIAHGSWALDGNVTDATPFSWTGGTGTANQAGATGTVGYTGSIHFTGHEGEPGVYALDLTFSNVRVVQNSATSATLVLDVRGNSMSDPGAFVEQADVAFATIDLAAATPTSTATTVGFSGAPAVLTEGGASAFSGFYGEGTALDPVTFSWPTEQAPVLPEPVTPTVTVSKTTGISPAGEYVTVTGAGFVPDAPATNAKTPPLAGKFGGVYVVFQQFGQDWKPSSPTSTSAARPRGETKWVVNPEDMNTIGGTTAGAVAINADGSFSFQMFVKKDIVGGVTGGNLGIYTYGGGSSKYAAFETYTPIAFSTEPTVSVSKTTDISPLGETVTVTGWNFTPDAPATNAKTPPLAGKFGGVYVVFQQFGQDWKPSSPTSTSAARPRGETKWVVSTEDVNAIGGAAAGAVAINPDGSFSFDMPVKPGVVGGVAGGNLGIYTYGGGSSKYAAFETYTPITFTNATGTTLAVTANPATLVEGGSTALAATVSPVAAGTVTFREGTSVLATVAVDGSGRAATTVSSLGAGVRQYTADFTPADPLLFAASTGSVAVTVSAKTVGAGSLTWGIKESFRSYVTGSIAHGSITTTGVGTSGGAFVFGQAAGGSFTESAGVGTSNYSGTVVFAGHSGALNVRVSNPTIRIDSASSGTLLVNVNGSTIAMATLNLAAGSRATPNNTVTYSGVPATLTAAGTQVFAYNGSSFYAAGDALDSVSFVIGSPSSVGGGTTTLASFKGARQPAATPPATTGITLDAAALKALKAGGEITATASGFQPNEKDILVVVYSDPTLLTRDLTADANGNVTWTGRLPAALTGSHTLTFQGSVSRGVVLEIPANVRTAAAGCEVTDASLSWGFKESFRSYVSGSIANGEWAVSDGATYETPLFGWAAGTGSYDAETAEGLLAFTGAITFTGHGGILNTTVSNPQVRFVDKDTAVILLDVSGTTQDGTAVSASGVEFVELDLAKATVAEKDGVYTITGAPATMLAAGAEAFGTYPAGEAFDAVDLQYTLDDACAAIAETEVTAMPISAEVETPADSSWIGWLLGGLALLALIALAVVLIIRRRSAGATSGE